MKSKAEIIRSELKGLHVLDIGGCGFGEDNAYERQLRDAWDVVASRVTVDQSERSDYQADLNMGLPVLPAKRWDIATAFDVLEHLEAPVVLLCSIPTERLLVSLPNVLSPFCRQIEKRDCLHLYSFTDYTAEKLLATGGWAVEKLYYTFGKWSTLSRFINTVGSLAPAYCGTGIMLHCRRK
jgi:hypothetical protein